MIEVIVKFEHMTGEKKGTTGEEKYRLGRLGTESDIKKLVVFSYQQYARRDVFVTNIEAKHWISQQLQITMGQEGKIQIGGRSYAFDEESLSTLEKVQQSFDNNKKKKTTRANKQQTETPKLTDRVLPPPDQDEDEEPVQNQVVVSSQNAIERNTSSQSSGNINSRREINTQEKIPTVGERLFEPSENEKKQGIVSVIVYDPPRMMVFDPISDISGFPVQRGQRVMVQENIRRRDKSGKQLELFKIRINQATHEIPSMFFIDAPLGSSDGILINKTCDDSVLPVEATVGKTVVSDFVPLQGSGQRGYLQRSPAQPSVMSGDFANLPREDPRTGQIINPDGSVYQDMTDIRAGR